MGPTPQKKRRPGVISLLVMFGLICAVLFVFAVILVWPVAVLYITVGATAAYVFLVGSLILLVLFGWRLIRSYWRAFSRPIGPSPAAKTDTGGQAQGSPG